jgi:predicted ester cyclase/ribosomal protein S18 acetylase RimI-like enzyme
MRKTVHIRVACLEDAPALAHVLIDTGRATYRRQILDEVLFKQPIDEAYAESERNWQRSLQEIAAGDNPQAQIFIAEDETGVVVGLAMGGPPKQELLPNSGELYVLYVCESHQRRGVGRALVTAVATHLAQMGLSALVIGCLATNAPARRFYERLGGRVIAEREIDQDGALLREVVYGWDVIQAIITRKGKPMSTKTIKDLVSRELLAWNEGRLEVIDEIYAPTFVNHFTGETPAALKQKIAEVRAAFPDVRITIDDQVAEGDRVVSRWTARGTHHGAFMGAPATHKPMAQTGISILRVADHQIVEGWSRADEIGLLQQLGLLPAMTSQPS